MNKISKFLKHATFTLLLIGMMIALEAHAHVINTNSTRFRDQNDSGCHMSPGAAGAPASGAAGAGGNQVSCTNCQSDSGISRWWVNEPYVNLHISDVPLSYFTSSGQPVVFRWLYKQRYKLPDFDEVPNLYNTLQVRLSAARSPEVNYMRTYGMTNASWSHNWMMNVLFWDAGWESVMNTNPNTTIKPYSLGQEALLFRAEGGVDYFYTNSSQAALSNSVSLFSLQPNSALGYPVCTNTPSTNSDGTYWGDPGIGFKLLYPDGSQDIFGLSISDAFDGSGHYVYPYNSTAHSFLTQRIDPHGRVTRLGYEHYNYTNFFRNPSGAEYVAWRIRYVVDPDGRTNTFIYHTNDYSMDSSQWALHGWQVIEFDDTYARKAQFTYPLNFGNSFSNGLLAGITDAMSNSSTFAYQGTNGWITNLTTPYGVTSFGFYSNRDLTITNGYIQRAVYVSEPEGAQQLFYYLHDGTGLLTNSLTGPTVTGQIFDTGATNGSSGAGNLVYRNTFHWDRGQFTALSSGFRNNVGSLGYALGQLSAADFRKGELRRWLLSAVDELSITELISSERPPSPGSGGETEAPRLWYNYANKGSPEEDGDAQVGCVAQVLPDGTTQSTVYRYSTGATPAPGLVLTNESTYTLSNGSIGARSNYFVYSTNAIDLLTISNSSGQFLKIAYDGSHQPTNIIDSLNQPTTLTFGPTHNLGGFTLPSGLSVALKYYASNSASANGSLLSNVTWSATGRSLTFTYTNSLPLTVSNDLGLKITNFWDGLNRLVGTTFPDGSSISNTYDRLSLAGYKDRMGNWTTVGYNGLEFPTSITNALTNVTLLSWCNCGSLASITDALTNTTSVFYNNQGLVTNILRPDNSSLTYAFDSVQRLTGVSDGLGRGMNLGYNNQGLATSISNAYGRVQAVLFDSLDRPIQITDAYGVTVTNTFDLLDRLLSRSYPSGGGTMGLLWNTNGLLAYTNQNQKVTWFNRDAAGRVLSVTNAKQEVVWLNYNSLNEVTDLWDGNSNHTTWAFNQYGWLMGKTNALREVLRLARNPNGLVTNRWTPQFGNTAFSPDALGNITNIAYTGYSNSYAFDALNRLKTMIDQSGTTAFSYTPAGQLLTEDGPWTNDTVTNSYTEGQRTTLAFNPASPALSQIYVYDSARRLGTISSLAGTFTYGYGGSPGSLVQTLGLPNAAYFTNHFDGLNRQDYTALVNYWGHVLDGYSYTHDPLGLRTNIVRDFGLTNDSVSIAYDAINQLASWSAKEASGAARQNEQLGFGFDAAHNLRTRTNGALVQTFNLDRGNEITNVTRMGTLTVSGATPAPATNVTVGGAVAELYGDLTFARTNNALSDTNTFTIIAKNVYGTNVTNTVVAILPSSLSLTNDSDGNLKSDGTRWFEYSPDEQLTAVTVSNAYRSEFVYDGLGRRRIQRDYKWQSGWLLTNETRLVYDGLLPIQERDSNNVAQASYPRGLDLSGTFAGAGGIGGLLARTDGNGASTFYHSDGAGNISTLIDAQQNIAARYLYGPFGNIIGRWGKLADANSMQFSSMPKHGMSGLTLYPFRAYDSGLQRWTSEDPIAEAGGINLYGFVGNSPLNSVDPFGLDLWMDRYGQPHDGVPPSEWPTTDPMSLGGLYRFGDTTHGQRLGDYFLNDFLKPAGEKSVELGLDVVAIISGIGEAEKGAEGGLGLWKWIKKICTKSKKPLVQPAKALKSITPEQAQRIRDAFAKSLDDKFRTGGGFDEIRSVLLENGYTVEDINQMFPDLIKNIKR